MSSPPKPCFHVMSIVEPKTSLPWPVSGSAAPSLPGHGRCRPSGSNSRYTIWSRRCRKGPKGPSELHASLATHPSPARPAGSGSGDSKRTWCSKAGLGVLEGFWCGETGALASGGRLSTNQRALCTANP
jgi:hypothetical protein